jgi:amidase
VDVDRPAPPPIPFAQAAANRPAPLRIAFSKKFPGIVLTKLDEHASRALDETVELLRSLGHDVQERDPEYGNDTMPNVIARYMRGGHDDVAALEHPRRLERRTRAFARLGGLVTPSLLERSFAAEQALTTRLNRVLEEFEFLITPSVAAPAPPIGALQGRGALWTLNAVAGWVPYNGVWNLTGQPAIAVPAGFSDEGMPQSVQIVARPEQEGPLLALAGQLETERPWVERLPAGFR